MKQEKLIELIISTLPYPQQITDIEFEEKMGGIRFTWRSSRYRISENRSVEQCENSMLSGSDNAILLEHLIKKTETLQAI